MSEQWGKQREVLGKRDLQTCVCMCACIVTFKSNLDLVTRGSHRFTIAITGASLSEGNKGGSTMGGYHTFGGVC